MNLTMGSLFDGIGGFPLAAERYGIKTLWASEIEPFPMKSRGGASQAWPIRATSQS